MITDYHAKYYAYELTRQRRGGDIDRISQSLFDASVDLNPHQIDAAIFALQNPLSKGVLLADEVGLGKTIEAALVLCQYWAERRRRLLVICPAALRKQWATELAEKFHLPSQVLDARTYRRMRKEGFSKPFDQDSISVISYNFAAGMEEILRSQHFDLVVIDEAHKLRNAHRESHRTGQAIKRIFAGAKKLLLTATPLQNSLIELYGLSTILDEHLFGDVYSFRSLYMRDGNNIEGLRERLKAFSKRTLRKNVLEYVPYTERKTLTFPFTPAPDEERLYDLVSAYLQREGSYGVPHRQRHLVSLVVRKLLASSTAAVINTLETMLVRLRKLEQEQQDEDDWLEKLIEAEDIGGDDLEEELEEETSDAPAIDFTRLRGEIAELEQYLQLARTIHEDEKSHALLKALETGFQRMGQMSAPKKAVIFTESRRTLTYLVRYLEQHGYPGKVVTFDGNNAGAAVTGIYQRWLQHYQGSDRITGSPVVDKRTALIDHFREEGQILIATEAAAEGVNLQFCNLLINHDLPWNPQRVEQRIGRCHRYGQKFDVVVINFLNQRNEADRRVLELLSEKFHLFDGLFGASDEILGRIESGVDIEQRIARIYDTCRLPHEIEKAFADLRKELEDSISARMKETEAKLLENFDEQIHELLKVQREKAVQQLDRIGQLFWRLSHHMLAGYARFNDDQLSFTLDKSPIEKVLTGNYRLIQKGHETPAHTHLYRLSHPLGEYVLDSARRLHTDYAQVVFSLSDHPARITVLESLPCKQGWLELNLLELHSFQREEHLVFTAQTDDGQLLDSEACERLFNIDGHVTATSVQPPTKLAENARRQIEAKLSEVLEENNQYFQREREKLDHWAEDQVRGAEQQLEETKSKIRDTKRRARQAPTLDEQKQLQHELKDLEKQQRRQRQNIFDVEDEIEARRDALIDALEKQLHQRSTTHHLFRIRWQLS